MRRTDVVVDASALVLAVTERSPVADALRARLAAVTTHAPHLVDAEVGNVLRRQVLRGETTADEAAASLDDADGLIDHRYGHSRPLRAMAWSLLKDVSFPDALYVALTAALGGVLLTGDGRLARAPGLPCLVEVVG